MTGGGGAVYSGGAEHGLFTLISSTLSENSALGDAGGGAISSGNTDQQLCLGSTLTGNTAPNGFGGGWLIGAGAISPAPPPAVFPAAALSTPRAAPSHYTSGVQRFQSGVGNGTIAPCVFASNSAVRGGGLAFVADTAHTSSQGTQPPFLNLVNTTFTGNSASTSGGGLFFSGAPLTAAGMLAPSELYSATLTNCALTGNNATGTGAGAELIAATVVMLNGMTMRGNAASGSNARGGALNVETVGSLSIDSSVFDSNSALVGTQSLTDVAFGQPQTISFGPGDGGAVFIGIGSLPTLLMGATLATSITGTLFTNNTASTAGGALALYNLPSATVSQCNFTGNSAATLDATAAPPMGGAVHVFGAAGTTTLTFITLTNCTLNNNVADEGGALSVVLASALQKVNLTSVQMAGNSALRGGSIRLSNTFTPPPVAPPPPPPTAVAPGSSLSNPARVPSSITAAGASAVISNGQISMTQVSRRSLRSVA